MTEVNEQTSLLRGSAENIINEDFEENVPSTSSFAAVFIIVNAAMGAGLLNMPQAFGLSGGIITGMTLQLVSNNILCFKDFK